MEASLINNKSEYKRMTFSEVKTRYPNSWVALVDFDDTGEELCGYVKYICSTITERSTLSTRLIQEGVKYCWVYTKDDEGVGILWQI